MANTNINLSEWRSVPLVKSGLKFARSIPAVQAIRHECPRLPKAARVTVKSKMMSTEQAVRLGLPGISAAASKNRKLFVQTKMKYIEVYKNEETYYWGVGVSWFAEITIIKSKLATQFSEIAEMAGIVAAHQLGIYSAASSFEVVGIPDAIKLLPKTKAIGVADFADVSRAIDEIFELVESKGIKLEPDVVWFESEKKQSSLWDRIVGK